MSHSNSQLHRRDSGAQSPAESSSDELAAGSDHDEAERRRASWTLQKGFTPQRPQPAGRHYSDSESPDELAVDAGEYWRSSRNRRRDQSPSSITRTSSQDRSQRRSNTTPDDDMSRPGAQDRVADDWPSRSSTPGPSPPPKPDHVNYKEKFVLRGHVRGVSQVQFSPDGAMIASAGMFFARVWAQRNKKIADSHDRCGCDSQDLGYC